MFRPIQEIRALNEEIDSFHPKPNGTDTRNIRIPPEDKLVANRLSEETPPSLERVMKPPHLPAKHRDNQRKSAARRTPIVSADTCQMLFPEVKPWENTEVRRSGRRAAYFLLAPPICLTYSGSLPSCIGSGARFSGGTFAAGSVCPHPMAPSASTNPNPTPASRFRTTANSSRTSHFRDRTLPR